MLFAGGERRRVGTPDHLGHVPVHLPSRGQTAGAPMRALGEQPGSGCLLGHDGVMD